MRDKLLKDVVSCELNYSSNVHIWAYFYKAMKGYKMHRFTWYWYVCRGGLAIIMQPLLFDALHVQNNQISCNIIVVLTWYFRYLFPRSEHLGAFVSFRPTYCIIMLLLDINSISDKQGKKKKGFTHFFHAIWWKFSGC